MSKFKTFATIEKFMKLYEAAEGEDDSDKNKEKESEEQPQDATEAAPEMSMDDSGADANAPEEQADVETGVYMSDNQKASMAKMMLNALMMTPPEPGTIPNELMNVTTQNADAVIKYIQDLNALSAPLSVENEQDPNSLGGALKDA